MLAETHAQAQHLAMLTATERAAHRRKLLRDMQHKAEEYLTAMCIEVGLAVDQREAIALQDALRQDFIEVHNAALRDPVDIPESKEEISKLLD
jgi:hypothetical protein